MSKNGALLAVSFVSAQLAGLIRALLLWAAWHWHVLQLLEVKLSPSLTPAHLYPLMITEGLWGLCYFLTVAIPRQRCHWIRKGLWCSLIPTLTTLFYIYPSVKHLGPAGTQLGLFTPAVVFISYLVWGFFTGFFTRLLWGR